MGEERGEAAVYCRRQDYWSWSQWKPAVLTLRRLGVVCLSATCFLDPSLSLSLSFPFFLCISLSPLIDAMLISLLVCREAEGRGGEVRWMMGDGAVTVSTSSGGAACDDRDSSGGGQRRVKHRSSHSNQEEDCSKVGASRDTRLAV